jgi:hypothetical protein
MPGDDRVKQTCAYLRMLLLRPGEYRSAWERQVTYAAPEEIDYAAVGQVLAAGTGGTQLAGYASAKPAPAGAGDGQLAETARQALEGTSLSAETLDNFIEAFGLGTRHANRLSELMRGSEAVRVIAGDVRPPTDLYRTGGPARHETLSLHELHILGPDGLPAEHQTIQVIRSTVDGLDSLPYRFDTDELVVEVVRGGRVGDRLYPVSETLYAVDIILTEPLAKGATSLLQYRTTFFYKSPPAPEFRRGVLGSTKDLTMWVTFHRERLPRRVWLARWDALNHAHVIDREPMELDDELSVHCRFDAVERAIVGFTWEWE